MQYLLLLGVWLIDWTCAEPLNIGEICQAEPLDTVVALQGLRNGCY